MKKCILIVLLFITRNYNCEAQIKKVEDFIPKGYVLFGKVYGDLNKDNQADCILMIKGTHKDKILVNQYDETVDRNRRGIVILFKIQNGYRKVMENLNCFSSENEDGGVYFPPELYLNIQRGNLIVHYGHGRYGFWSYTFRYQDSNFKLIGYDESNDHGPVVNRKVSINFLTKKKLVKENTNENAIGGDEIFKESWSKIQIKRLLSLSEIINFDHLDMPY